MTKTVIAIPQDLPDISLAAQQYGGSSGAFAPADLGDNSVRRPFSAPLPLYIVPRQTW